MTVHPILAGLETLCVLSSMQYKVADRVLEHAVLSNYIRQRNVFLAARNYGCRHNALRAAVTNGHTHRLSAFLSLRRLSVATGVRPHTKSSKIGDLVPVHVGTWYAFTAM